VVELVDTKDLKSFGSNTVPVRFRPRAFFDFSQFSLWNSSLYVKSSDNALRRNIDRFPEDFMFELTKDELEILRFQFGTSSWGGKRYQPFAFTEQGVAV
jgi:hypothetical protein